MSPVGSTADRPVVEAWAGSRAARTRASALWAAYADAVGWISELTDARGLARRLGSAKPIRGPVSWRRKIGGKTGPIVDLVAGTYSDDTQLRLAVGRAIGPRGFDVEAFAAVELPVWPGYSLGGGLSSKAAASNLAKPTPWFANFFDGWADAGGNGVAMRVQPHIWAATELDAPNSYLKPLIRDALSTHGHPVALAGAALHACTLALVLSTGQLPGPDSLQASVEALELIPKLIREDPELGELWLPAWENQSGRRYVDAWSTCLDELRAAIHVAGASGPQGSGATGYHDVLVGLKLYEPSLRGSGVLTAIAGAALTWCEPEAAAGIAVAANELGSDTDTIATMAGALYGAAAGVDPRGPVLDAELIAQEANRFTAIAVGEARPSHQYPDLLRWSPPRTQADALVTDGTHLHVLGLGPVAEELGEAVGAGAFLWRHVRLQLGQTLIVKSRRALPVVPQPVYAELQEDRREGGHHHGQVGMVARDLDDLGLREGEGQLFTAPSSDLGGHDRTRPPLDRGINLDRVIGYLEEHGYDDAALGYSLRRVARDGTRDQLVAFVASIRGRLRQRP